MKVPRWLELQEEIDYWLFVLNSMRAEVSKRSAIDRMIDEATGREKDLTKQAKKVIARLKKLRSEYEKLMKEGLVNKNKD